MSNSSRLRQDFVTGDDRKHAGWVTGIMKRETGISQGEFKSGSWASEPTALFKQPTGGTARTRRRGEMLAVMRLHLIAGLAHELRGPLTSIQGYARMILLGRAGPISGTQREYLTAVANSTSRIIQTLDGLRSTLDQLLDPECFDIRDLWPELQRLANPILSEKSIRLTAQISAQQGSQRSSFASPRLHSDPGSSTACSFR